MKTFLKVFLYVLLALLVIKLLPLLGIAAAAVGGITLVLAGLAFSGVAAILGVIVSLAAAILAPLIVLAALLSPIWVPVLLVVGVMALVKRSRRVTV
jgi:hypothetical protein